jgi:hypothetical protein
LRLSELINGDRASSNTVLKELAAAGVLDLDIQGVTSDSRAVRPGFLFAALPGSATDGRRFIADAVARGAVAVLTPLDTNNAGLHTLGTEAYRRRKPPSSSGLPRRPLLWGATRNRRCCHRDQRQNLGRRVRPSALARDRRR